MAMEKGGGLIKARLCKVNLVVSIVLEVRKKLNGMFKHFVEINFLRKPDIVVLIYS